MMSFSPLFFYVSERLFFADECMRKTYSSTCHPLAEFTFPIRWVWNAQTISPATKKSALPVPVIDEESKSYKEAELVSRGFRIYIALTH